MTIEKLYNLYLDHPNVQTDTRKLKKGDLFFALKGPSFDGNAFTSKAIEMGAEYAVIDNDQYFINGKTILVPDVLETLQKLALYHRKQFSIPFLAITGSNGKTTTKELIHSILSSTYKTYTTEGNLNNHIGVPLTLLKIKSDAEMAVIEMGANHLREIALYCSITLPTHGLITNCGKAHLEGFGGIEGVRKGKGELFDHLRATNGTAFIMSDYDYLLTMSKGIKEIYTYGTKDAIVEGRIVKSDPFLEVLISKGLNIKVASRLVGDYNLPNVLAAAAVGKYFNINDQTIKAAIESYEPTNSRSQLVIKGNKKIILDAYNANPSSMKLAIENFSKSSDAKKILVLGSMAELGNETITEHKAIIEVIKKYNWEEVLLIGKDFKSEEQKFRYFNTAEEAGKWLLINNKDNDSFLIKGSRSMQMEKVLEFL